MMVKHENKTTTYKIIITVLKQRQPQTLNDKKQNKIILFIAIHQIRIN